jgi:acyl-coenzyme A synthetase/AMP-(fatty) acid ligase
MMSIRDALHRASDLSRRFLWGGTASVCLDDLLRGTSLGGRLPELSDRSVLIAARDQLAAAVALAELDGVARRLVICPPDVSPEHLPSVAARAEVDAIVSDRDVPDQHGLGVPLRVTCDTALKPATAVPPERRPTEWVLLTSGTTGSPKMIAHSFAGLTAAIKCDRGQSADVVWGTCYDIRRYGGLQIFLRALLGPGSFVLSNARESTGDFLVRLGIHGVTHISGTPSQWRRVLMSPHARAIAPRYVRLSGEIADQAILKALGSCYPQAAVGHAYASTEAGVGFEVNDGLEGFPARMIGAPGDVEMKIEDGSLRIRSGRTAVRYVGEEREAIADGDGFVDTGDMVERRGDRYHFLGRKSGVINIGGLKVYPEEVEAVINHHRAVRVSIVRSRKSPIMGSLVAADVVLREEFDPIGAHSQVDDLKREILQICHQRLAAHKIPATIRFVPALDLAPAGKIARHHA